MEGCGVVREFAGDMYMCIVLLLLPLNYFTHFLYCRIM